MTKQTIEARRAELERLAAAAETRVAEYTAREQRFRAKGNVAKAKAAARTIRRQSAIAAGHRRTLDGLENASRRASLARSPAKAPEDRTEAEARMSAINAAKRREIDPLEAYDDALKAMDELSQEVIRNHQQAIRYRMAGNPDKAALRDTQAEHSAKRLFQWKEEAKAILDAAAATGRDLRRERDVARKAAERRQSKARTEEARLRDLKLVDDVRTAASAREITAGGPRGARVASMVADYGKLLARPEDRSEARIKAMRRFDDLCGTAEAGLFPEPKFERESGSGKGPGSLVMLNRAAGLEEMADLTDAIGAPNVAMLRGRIYLRQTFAALVRDGIGSERTIAALFLAAVDSIAVFFRTRSVMQARLAGYGGPGPKPRAASDDQDATAAR